MTLSRAETARRARRLKLILTDSDGVLTDTGVYYSDAGEAFKRFSIRDGMGVERLRAAGIETAIITGELSESVRRRAEKLNMPYLFLGIKDKRLHLPQILRETRCTLEEVGYIGDDVNDLGIMKEVHGSGLTAAPADAMPEIRRLVHYRTAARAGQGAFRDFAEWILKQRH
jgi:3-deoxy-D-manno-octulosonate 8-phosphate phosphatase (KDO 8-P phosphatase)